MPKKIKILILMATYNGEKYLSEQLESIINQDYINWQLIISDDCSNDNTIEICKRYIDNDHRIILYQQDTNVGPLRNFSWLIQKAKEPAYNNIQYIMFADQDDVWLANKISISVRTIHDKEQNNLPALLYTSKCYVNHRLNKIKNIKNIKNESRIVLSRLLVQNIAYGCTMIFNRALLNTLEDIPDGFSNHDYYVVLQCFLHGRIFFLNTPTILYRQHQNNNSGNVYRPLKDKLFNYNSEKVDINLFHFIVEYLFKNRHKLNKKEVKMISTFRKHKRDISLLFYLYYYNVTRTTILSTFKFYVAFIFLVKNEIE